MKLAVGLISLAVAISLVIHYCFISATDDTLTLKVKEKWVRDSGHLMVNGVPVGGDHIEQYVVGDNFAKWTFDGDGIWNSMSVGECYAVRAFGNGNGFRPDVIYVAQPVNCQ